MEQVHGSWKDRKLRAVGFSWIWSVLPFLGARDNELKGDIDLEAVVHQIYQGSEYPCFLLQIGMLHLSISCPLSLFPLVLRFDFVHTLILFIMLDTVGCMPPMHHWIAKIWV